MDENGGINIPRDYFETLVRRAELHRDDDDYITIRRAEYSDLVRISRQYSALRCALVDGGVTAESLELLTQIPDGPALNQDENQPLVNPAKWSIESPVFIPKVNRRRRANVAHGSLDADGVLLTPPSLSNDWTGEELDADTGHQVDEHDTDEYYESNHEDRSIVIRGLSQHTTLADIAKVVRGGLVLNMFIRPRQRTAHVAFVDPIAAEKFTIYSKRSDIYIKGKRVEVYWDKRQHYMAGHIARRIQNGATRNLVIRFANPNMTPDSIREDLEHIHHLDVVDITMNGSHAFISTNGVNWAFTAKTCMSSRLKYKGTKIEFYPDECDEPLPCIIRKQQKPPSIAATTSVPLSRENRFALLMEDGEEEFEEAHTGSDPVGRTEPAAS